MLTIGAQITAPDGFGQIRKATRYYFTGDSRKTQRVVLVFFEGTTAHALTISRDKFEGGLSRGELVASENPSTLPPWLERLEGKNLDKIDAERPNSKLSYRDYTDRRLLQIQPVIDNLEEFFSAEDVDSAINAAAKVCTPRQNETRYRTWVLTYICFGRNRWALLPPFNNIGRWDRNRCTTKNGCATKKQGAPSKAFGKGYGHRMTRGMADLCIEGYEQFESPGKTMGNIYAETMIKKFGCKIREVKP
ncbi:hypothetical protein [Paraburkholderia sp. BR10954]|uniref:hypothetical protein n=1 Tax=Paraburkholderia sp. BR10954 TaxID=3236995 RepID=UPI0034D1DC4A